MPTIVDATVVASAYDTSGNGGRKLVRLENRWLVSAVFNPNNTLYFYKSTDNGNTWTQLCYQTNAVPTLYFSLSSVGTMVYLLYCTSAGTGVGYLTFDATTQTNVAITSSGTIDSSQTAFNGISTTINEAGTELHAFWSSKNATYPNSFNIRYAKGTISAVDGSVTWSAIEQVTIINTTGSDYKNPSIIIKGDGNPAILSDYNNSTSNNKIYCHYYNGNYWASSYIDITGYTQSSPSAIFVPQSINGLANGLIGTAWHGTDSTSAGVNYIRFRKAIDGIGATWSAMQKLVVGTNATLTSNKIGKLFITYEDSGITKRIESTDNGDTWSSAITVGTGTNPSSLFDLTDLTVNMSVPLTIRKGTSSVLFTGTWTVTTISVTQGSIGTKTDKSNLLTYAITTDGTMSTITEVVNGVTVGTKTATSGESLIVGLTQTQWDAIKFGKYKDVTGGLNTLTIIMGTDVFTYTFDKRPASDVDITSAIKVVQDAQDTFLPSVKAKLVARVGGSTSDTFENIINGITLKKQASGTTTVSSSTLTFVQNNGNSTSQNYVDILFTDIGFIPDLISIYKSDKSNTSLSFWSYDNLLDSSDTARSNSFWTYTLISFRTPYTLLSDRVRIPVYSALAGATVIWKAYER